MKMSSEAVVDLIRGLGFEVKSHMSTVEPDIIAKIHSKMDAEKEAVKAEVVRKREHDVEVARRAQLERQQRDAAQRAAAPAAPGAPRAAGGAPGGAGTAPPPAARPGGGSPPPGSSPYANRPGGTTGASRPQGGGYGGPSMPPRYGGPGGGPGPSRFGGGPGGPGGRRRMDKKKKRPVDDKLVTDSV